MTDLTPYLARLEALRPFLRGDSLADLHLVIGIVREGIRRTNVPVARDNIAMILDMLLAVDPRFVAGPLAHLAQTAARAVNDLKRGS